MTVKNSKIINNSMVDCSTLLKLVTDFDNMTPDVRKTFEVKSQRSRLKSEKNNWQIIALF